MDDNISKTPSPWTAEQAEALRRINAVEKLERVAQERAAQAAIAEPPSPVMPNGESEQWQQEVRPPDE